MPQSPANEGAMNSIDEILEGVGSAAVMGHIRPDGDCVGSCLGVWNYLKSARPDIEVQVYLEDVPEVFLFLPGADKVSKDPGQDKTYDICLAVDASDKQRLGPFARYFDSARRTACIDHHVTNTGFAQTMHVEPQASSTCEILYALMDDQYVDPHTAECLYVGMLTDSGCFRHSSTTLRTMDSAGRLMEKGVPFTNIIESVFYERTYKQAQILGRLLSESVLILDGRCIFSVMRLSDMQFYQAVPADLEGVIDQLKSTKGVECAILITEVSPMQFKVSMRSKEIVDVSAVAAYFGGGGHVRAAGCTMSGTAHDVINNLAAHIERQLDA